MRVDVTGERSLAEWRSRCPALAQGRHASAPAAVTRARWQGGQAGLQGLLCQWAVARRQAAAVAPLAGLPGHGPWGSCPVRQSAGVEPGST